MRYDAFISYSHAADNAAAPALQAALHAFARPWNRMRALHVFRDQTSLAASPELWPAIEAALADARWLLLMASPEATASRWVAREIDWWLTHRPVQTLLIVLTGGELAWDDAAGDFDWQRTTCLPRAVLSGRLAGEPLWVDLRWAKSADVLTLRHARFRQAVLDVAAPLHGRPKDELDGEDVRRFAQMQRMRAAAIAALVGLTVLAGTAAWVAVGQRDEARRQATIAQAGRIAVQADLLRERGGPVDSSVMLAAEALRMLDGIGERSPDADQSLRRALAGLPESRGTLELSADALRLTSDGSLLVATHAADQISVHTVPKGLPRGCARDTLAPLRQPASGERLWLVDAISDDGAWCVVHVLFEGSDTHALELWSATPLRQVARVTLPSQAGHVRPAIAPGGRWLAATDVAQSGDASAAVVRLWWIGGDGRIGEPQTLAGMALLAFSPDGRHFATSAGLWRLPEHGPTEMTAGPERRIAWESPPWKIAFSADGAQVATQAGPDTQVVIWDLSTGKDRLRASPPPGELLALSTGGTRLVVAGGRDSTIWDAELDVARAKLPLRADAAAFLARGRVLFVVPALNRIGLQGQQLLALPEDPTALRATVFPGAATSVQALLLSRGGEVHVVELTGARTRADAVSQRSHADGDTIRLHRWDSRDGTWYTTATLEGVTAFALAADGSTFAAAEAGQVLLAPTDGSAPPQTLAPGVAANLLAFSGDASRVLAYASAPAGGIIHVWHRAGGRHWSMPVEGTRTPSTMAVTRDGSAALAIVAHGEATRGGTPYQLLRWRMADSTNQAVVVELGRRLHPPASICEVLGDRGEARAEAVGASGIGVTRADMAECGDTPAVSAWRIVENDRQATVFAPSGAVVARIDHAAKVLRAAVSVDGREAVTLDESGHVQRFAVEPKELIAQACLRQPAPLSDELRASLPAQAQAVDACGRAPDAKRAPDTAR